MIPVILSLIFMVVAYISAFQLGKNIGIKNGWMESEKSNRFLIESYQNKIAHLNCYEGRVEKLERAIFAAGFQIENEYKPSVEACKLIKRETKPCPTNTSKK